MKTKLLFLAFLLFFGWLVGREWWWKDARPDAETIVVAIEKGSSVKTVAEVLKEQKVIGSPFLFEVYAKITGRAGQVKAGEFELQRGMSSADVLAVVTDARASEITLTFVEGWTLEQMGAYLEGHGVLSKSAWEAVATDDLEGYLFPDTYRFLKGVTAEEIVERMRSEMEEKVSPEIRSEIERKSISLHELLTMASIIEREVHGKENRELVSDVFWKRVAIGMPLQADSTVNYVTGKKDPSISFEDRDVDLPYNTYKYRGLPPGPISAPSLEAITAAAYPVSNPYYFFLTDEKGNVYFAKTLEEHNVNKARYLK